MSHPCVVRPIRAAFVAALFASALPASAAQAQADTLSGRVVAADSAPIPTARVSTTAADGRTFASRTDSAGRYRIIVPAHNAGYVVTAVAFGYSGLTATVEVPAGSFRASRTFRLNPRRLVLDTLTVRGGTGRIETSATTPGETHVEASALSLVAFGIDPSQLFDAAALESNAFLLGDGLLSVGGQSPSQNRTSVDGAGFGGATLPSEGVRGVALLGNSYDPARGQFSGGEVAARTLSGTNRWGGALSARLDDPRLRYGALPGDGTGERTRDLRLSGGGGGALVRDRLFVYGALDLSRRSGPAVFLDLADPAGLSRAGLAPDSAARLVAIARQLGVPAASASPERSDYASGLARIDYTLSPAHALTVRLDGRGSRLSDLGSSPLRLPSDGGGERSWDAGVFAQLASGGSAWGNELRIYRTRGESRPDDDDLLPSATVHVSSVLGDGTLGFADPSFGGLPFLLPEGRRAAWELADELVRETSDGAHRIRLGVLLQEESASRTGTPNHNGAFTFGSLEDLEAGHPAAFTRTLAGASPELVSRYGAVFAGDTWRVSRRVRVIGGFRVEAARLAGDRERPPAVDSLAVSGSAAPDVDFVVSPRFGFSASIPGRGHVSLRGGVGLFRGAVPLAPLTAAWSETGSERRLACVGPASPVPDWAAYASGDAAIPTACRDGSPAFASTAPAVTAFSRGFGAPRTWRGSLGAGGSLGRRSWYSVDAMLAAGSHLASATDRNRVPNAAFVLADEDGRPVYASPAAIDPASGGVAGGSSRTLAALGPMREVGSGAHSRVGQLTAGVGGFVEKATLLSLSLTLTRAEDQVGGVPAPSAPIPSTAGDGAKLEWAPSDWDRRLALQGIMTRNVGLRVRLGIVARAASGLPFTPRVAGDVNGDGFLNDRAFVFAPAGEADSAVANGMARLLEDGPASVRACLRRQLGGVAARNSCRGGWSPSLDGTVEILARGDVDSRRLIVTLTGSNLTAGLDYLLHGPGRLRGWGQYPLVDGTLLRVRGFDPASRAYRYEVNANFGRRPVGTSVWRAFSLVLSARVAVGADPRYQPLERLAEAAGGGSRQEVTARIRAHLAREVRNVPGAILALDAAEPGALGLTPAQTADLQRASDALRRRLSPALDALAAALAQPGPSTAAKRAAIDDRATELQSLAEEGMRSARRALTAQQWETLPAWVLRGPRRTELERPVFEVTVPISAP